MTIQWDDAELQAALNQIQQQLPERLSGCVSDACNAIEAEAKSRCPANTGTLRASITSDVSTNGGTVIGIVGTNLEYAPYVHEGTGIYARQGNGRRDVPWVYFDERNQQFVRTKGIKPTPFLEEAADKIGPQLIDYFRGVMGNA